MSAFHFALTIYLDIDLVELRVMNSIKYRVISCNVCGEMCGGILRGDIIVCYSILDIYIHRLYGLV